MHINKAPVIHEEAVSPPQHLPGLPFTWVLPGRSTKPSHREQVSAGRSAGTALLRPQALGGGTKSAVGSSISPGTGSPDSLSALAGSSPTYLLSISLPKTSGGPAERKRGGQRSSCSPEIRFCGCEQAKQLSGAGCSTAGPDHRYTVSGSPSTGALDTPLMDLLAKPSPEPPPGPEQILKLCFNPPKGGGLHPLLGGAAPRGPDGDSFSRGGFHIPQAQPSTGRLVAACTASRIWPGDGGSPGARGRHLRLSSYPEHDAGCSQPPPDTISESKRWLSRFAGRCPLRQSKISMLLQLCTCMKSGGNLMAHKKGNKSIRTESLFVYVSCHEHHHEQQQQQVYVQAPFIYIIKLPSRFVAQGHPCLSMHAPNSH